MSRRAGWRSCCSGRLETGEPDVDERPYRVVEPGFARDRESLLPALTRLRRAGALLQSVVARDQEFLDPCARVLGIHEGRAYNGRARQRCYARRVVLPVLAVIHVLLSFAMVALVLLHSGRDTGFGGMGFTPASQGGTHIVERNLTRLTVAVGVVYTVNTVALYHLLK